MSKDLKKAMLDALGFLAGALIGFGFGQLTGLDAFAPGYGAASLIGILLVGIGGGLGVQLSRKYLQD